NGGSLVNCVPPLYLSPLGPCQYLQEMLKTPIGSTTLMTLVSQRRGPVGALAVTKDNLEIQLPLIDLVIESLKLMAVTLAVPGAIYDTGRTGVLGVRLNGDSSIDMIQSLIGAVPQHSSPSL